MKYFAYLCTRFWVKSLQKCASWCILISPGFVIGRNQRERHGGAWLDSPSEDPKQSFGKQTEKNKTKNKN